jgi:hypothetical protein
MRQLRSLPKLHQPQRNLLRQLDHQNHQLEVRQ